MLTMKDMALKMANNETQSRSQIEEYWSEHFLSKFGLEYIKYDILIKKRECKNKDILKDRAIQKIAQVLRIEANENNIMNMCIKFRQEILLLLRCVVRQCFLIGWDMKEKWQMDFALLLMPPWLRTVEMELVMLPQAVLMECVAVTAETAVTTRFKVLLEEGGSVVFPRWDTFDAGDFKKVSAYYNISRTEARDVWSGMCSKSRQRIMQEVQCREGSREVNFEVTDLLLLHDLTFRLVTPESLSKPKQLQKLTTLYQCVLKRNVENVLRNERPRLLEVWMQVLAEYPFSMGFSSVVYIQRQWYELKQLARSEVLAFHLQQPRPHHHPHPLLLSIVANFRHIVQEPLPKWSEFVTSKMVVKFKDITKTLSKKVLEGWMDELIKATEQSGIQNKSLQKHICIVQPLNSNKNIIKINKETQTNTIESNKLMENTSNENNIINQNIKDKESENLNKSDLNIDNMNECVASIHSSVANKINVEGNIDFNVFNNIDPTKAKKCFIFDSDSDSETLSAISLNETDRQTFQTELNSDMSQTSEDSKVLDWFKENGEKSKQIKENLQSKIDPKLRKEITIPLIRCDEIPAWKKYYKNNTININNIKNELCSLKCKNKKINTTKILKRQTRSNNSIYYDLNINCEGLSENFLRNNKNKLLFKLCKRLSVNLQRFTHKQRTLCRRRKKIQLTDIEEVRKINSTILTAEVAPVSITKCDPPSEGDFGILSDESMIEVTNDNVIDALELDELFNKLPVPSLTSINLDKPTETTNIATGHDNINSEQNKTNTKEENYEDLNKKILYIIMNGPVKTKQNP
ncbi:PREDICTED: uncharacterized protein LOC106123788 [Papilio xuthus]|uniref:Uncharacterized protein LOC106123788 n=1 Tax=Papilio xuthus TaxID=66420 RepID=A0AAJ7EFQ2_PAPXU|nr:PREDICTED: uncharacterized protein LOC106123788 [Papilio xuthus]